jgi:hypothetical protein
MLMLLGKIAYRKLPNHFSALQMYLTIRDGEKSEALLKSPRWEEQIEEIIRSALSIIY